MATIVLPRGITEVSWKNQGDKHRTVKYRVRVNRKTGKWNELFDTFEEAEKCLNMTKTHDGRLGLTEREARDKQMAAAIADYLSRPPLRHYLIDRYAAKYIGHDARIEKRKARGGFESVYLVKFGEKDGEVIEDREVSATQYRSIKTNLSRLAAIVRTLVPWYPEKVKAITGILAQFKKAHPAVEKKPLGEFQLHEITAQTASDFISARLATAAKPTVRREVGQMQTFYNKLPILDEGLALPHGNPFAKADRALLKGHNKKRRRVLTSKEEKRLFNVLANCRSKADKRTSRKRTSEMPMVVALALATGMRRSEALYLRWEQVKATHIELQGDETKSGDDRLVGLSKEAKAVLARIPRRDARLFHYTADGFKSNWNRAVEKAGIDNLRFHDLRRTMISRFVASISASAVVISERTGMRHIKHIEDEYVQPIKERQEISRGIRTEAALRRSVGHKRQQMTAHYTSLFPHAGAAKRTARKGGGRK